MSKRKRGKSSQAPRTGGGARTKRQAKNFNRGVFPAQNMRTGGFIGKELKFKDYGGNQLSLLASVTDSTGSEMDPNVGGTPLCLNGIGQGNGQSDRDGKNIILKAVYLNGNITMGAFSDRSGATASALVFLALVLDKQTNGAQLNSEDVFTNPTATNHGQANPIRNLEYSDRFDVLWSKSYVLAAGTSFYTGTTDQSEINETRVKFKKYKRLHIPVTYTGTGSTVSTVMNNSLHVVAFCTGQNCVLNYNSRVRFIG